MKGFSNRWKDFPDYILGITREIWEDHGIATLNHYYASDIPVRTPMGFARGNEPTMAATMATLAEFPDRQLLGEDVIWSGDPVGGCCYVVGRDRQFLAHTANLSPVRGAGPGTAGHVETSTFFDS